MKKLFTEFNPVTTQQWKDQLVKDLKGIDFNQLIWHTDNGIDINPFYTREDNRSEGGPLFNHSDWNIGETIAVSDEKKANQSALAALNGGVSCLSFCLDGNKNLEILLEGIYIEHIAIQFMLNNQVAEFDKQLNSIISTRGLNREDLHIAVNYDILAHLVEHGSWLNDRQTDLSDFAKVSGLSFNTYKLVVDGSLYQNAGANQVTELAMVLSHYNEYLNYLSESGFDFSTLKKGTQVNVSVGSDFFAEIAKLRALKQLIALLHKTYGIEAPLLISCTTSHLTLTAKDAYTNLLRSTTQAMSAVIGGCDTLYVTPFDALYDSGRPHFSERMAHNQQLILKEESYLNKAADIGAGSYYIESLTEQLASKAFDLFKAWEAKGGFIACLQAGIIQTIVNEQANKLKEKAASGELVIIGANKYVNPSDVVKTIKTTVVDPANRLFEPVRAIRLAEKFELEQLAVKNN